MTDHCGTVTIPEQKSWIKLSKILFPLWDTIFRPCNASSVVNNLHFEHKKNYLALKMTGISFKEEHIWAAGLTVQFESFELGMTMLAVSKYVSLQKKKKGHVEQLSDIKTRPKLCSPPHYHIKNKSISGAQGDTRALHHAFCVKCYSCK